MIGRSTEPVDGPQTDVAVARRRLNSELTRADRAIQKAMHHADEVFGSTKYRGPERRTSRR